MPRLRQLCWRLALQGLLKSCDSVIRESSLPWELPRPNAYFTLRMGSARFRVYYSGRRRWRRGFYLRIIRRLCYTEVKGSSTTFTGRLSESGT